MIYIKSVGKETRFVKIIRDEDNYFYTGCIDGEPKFRAHYGWGIFLNEIDADEVLKHLHIILNYSCSIYIFRKNK